ncbi:XdhC family protein [Microbacterium sp. GCS4]|uniref:XdhC family protein n=1 Tax=Microbacterium sp. GCS4 TaxID=1692239 RepID=UPI00067FE867|nr:XdhC/CoxI family protein [Microbacterium sp. GCS4]
MLDRIHDYAECLADPDRWAIATIVEVSGSVPRPPGTSMAVRDDGRTIGSISGGCVEGAVVDAALGCLESGSVELHSFGYADDDGISIGLLCGGDVRVLVHPLRTLPSELLFALAAPEPGLRLVRDLPLDDSARNGGALRLGRTSPGDASSRARALLPNASAASNASDAAEDPLIRAALEAGGTHVVDIADRSRPECPVARRVLVESTAAPARLLIYGANDFAVALAQAAALLGRRVTVCDARPVFATSARHPGAHEVVLMPPAVHFAREAEAGRLDARTAVVVLTHDPRVDLPVLEQALRSGVAYVGAMGSRVTHEKRMQELRSGGIPDALLARLHSPIGLDLGARTPAEVAVSILAELVLATSGGTRSASAAVPRRLRDTDGAVHDTGRTCAAAPTIGRVPTTPPTATEVPAWM